MSENWFTITPWELAYLASTKASEVTALDRLMGASDWLRVPTLQTAGAALFADRISGLPADTAGSVVRPLLVAARLLVLADRASALVFRDGRDGGVSIVTAVAAGVASQVACKPAGVAIRPIAWPYDSEALSAEVTEALAEKPVEAIALRWQRSEGWAGCAWRGGEIWGEPASFPEAASQLCAFGLFAEARGAKRSEM
jgi:hypothetical protein